MSKEKEVIKEIQSVVSSLGNIMDSSDVFRAISKVTSIIDDYTSYTQGGLDTVELEEALQRENARRIKLARHVN